MFKLLLFLVVAYSGSVGVQSTAQETLIPEGMVTCMTCDGVGRAMQRCWVCDGEGEHTCPVCRHFAPKGNSRVIPKFIPISLALLLIEERERRLIEDMLRIQEMISPGSSKKSSKSIAAKPGYLKCPTTCRGGKILLINSLLDCKFCSKGRIPCGFCKKSRVDCHYCKGDGQVIDPCDDCAGVGYMLDPTDLMGSRCPWCMGSSERSCGTCDQAGKVQTACPDCHGLFPSPCKQCKGLERIPCTECGGRGVTGQSKDRCATCAGKGGLPCGACTDGHAVCARCVAGRVQGMVCPDCGGEKKHPCNGCAFGTWRAWEYTAQSLMGQKNYVSAEAWLLDARLRCERVYANSLEEYQEVEDVAQRRSYQKLIKRELKQELRRIDRLIKNARKAADSSR